MSASGGTHTRTRSRDEKLADLPPIITSQSTPATANEHERASEPHKGHRSRLSVWEPLDVSVSSADDSPSADVIAPLPSPGLAPPRSPHRRVHSRNLSVFFPQPGAAAPAAPAEAAEDDPDAHQWVEAPVQDIPAADVRRGSAGGFRLGSGTAPSPNRQSFSSGPPPSPSARAGSEKPGRRKHHHKRSLSHAFFSFNDPTQTTASLAPLTAPDHHHPSPDTPFSPSFSFTPSDNTPRPVPFSPNPLLSADIAAAPAQRAKATFGIAEFALGAWVWAAGQRCESLATTGLGYLVVFDACGILTAVWLERLRTGAQASPSYRRPFGIARLETLALFTNIIFLLFSTVYIAKESVEHALLSISEDEADHAYGIPFPTFSLLLSFFACLISNFAFSNHSRLVQVTGTSLASTPQPGCRRLAPPKASLSSLFVNPFTLTILLTSFLLLAEDLLADPPLHHLLDKAFAGLETLAMAGIAWPSLLALGKVLLQTAPPERSPQMLALNRALRDLEQHHLITHVELPRVFQLTPHAPAAVLPTPAPTPAVSRTSSLVNVNAAMPIFPAPGSRSSSPSRLRANDASCALIVALELRVREDASDADVLGVTQLAWDRLAGVVAEEGSELTVDVKRGAGASWDDR